MAESASGRERICRALAGRTPLLLSAPKSRLLSSGLRGSAARSTTHAMLVGSHPLTAVTQSHRPLVSAWAEISHVGLSGLANRHRSSACGVPRRW